jgi:hypothetical protein
MVPVGSFLTNLKRVVPYIVEETELVTLQLGSATMAVRRDGAVLSVELKVTYLYFKKCYQETSAFSSS